MINSTIKVNNITLGNTARVTLAQEQFDLLDDCEVENNFDECINDNLEEVFLKEINCTVPWVKNKKNICKVWLDIYKDPF